MEIKNFDRRFHKTVFFNRLAIAIYSLLFPILTISLFIILCNVTDIEIATDVFIHMYLFYILGFIVYSIFLIIFDKKVKYDFKKINKKYKTGFIVSKVLSYVQFVCANGVLVFVLIIGLLGSSLNAGNQFDIGEQNNLEPEYTYTLEEYNNLFNSNTIDLNPSEVSEFVYCSTNTNRNLRRCEFYTTYIKYINNLNYTECKNNLFLSNIIIRDVVATDKGRYIFPVTGLIIEGYKLFICEGNSLSNMKIIGYSNEDYALVILETDGSRYDHFGKDLSIASQAFEEYVINFYHLPWFENENNENDEI